MPHPPAPAAAAPPPRAGPPPAPWHCRVRAVIWWHRAGPAARALVPAELGARALLPVTLGAALRYLDSPVGPYSEVIGVPVVLAPLRVWIPFIAVDSAASVEGGRALWALPKVLAAFSQAEQGRTAVSVADGHGWQVTSTTRTYGGWLPGAAVFAGAQLRGGRPLTATSVFAGRVRPARTEVHVQDGPDWLRPGRHPAVVLSGRLRVGAPR